MPCGKHAIAEKSEWDEHGAPDNKQQWTAMNETNERTAQHLLRQRSSASCAVVVTVAAAHAHRRERREAGAAAPLHGAVIAVVIFVVGLLPLTQFNVSQRAPEMENNRNRGNSKGERQSGESEMKGCWSLSPSFNFIINLIKLLTFLLFNK